MALSGLLNAALMAASASTFVKPMEIISLIALSYSAP